MLFKISFYSIALKFPKKRLKQVFFVSSSTLCANVSNFTLMFYKQSSVSDVFVYMFSIHIQRFLMLAGDCLLAVRGNEKHSLIYCIYTCQNHFEWKTTINLLAVKTIKKTPLPWRESQKWSNGTKNCKYRLWNVTVSQAYSQWHWFSIYGIAASCSSAVFRDTNKESWMNHV